MTPPSLPNHRLRSLAVLSIEDEPDHAELLRLALLQIPGLVLDFQAEGDADRGLLRAAARRFDAIFVDHGLGTRDGLDVTRALRASGFDGRVVLVTAHWRAHLQAEAERSGADAYLNKAYIAPRSLAAALDLDLDGVTRSGSASRADARGGEVLDGEGLSQLIGRVRARAPDAAVAVLVVRAVRVSDRASVRASETLLGRVFSTCREGDGVGFLGDDLVIVAPRTSSRGAAVLAERLLAVMGGRATRMHEGRDDEQVLVGIGAAASTERSWSELRASALSEALGALAAGGARYRIARDVA